MTLPNRTSPHAAPSPGMPLAGPRGTQVPGVIPAPAQVLVDPTHWLSRKQPGAHSPRRQSGPDAGQSRSVLQWVNRHSLIKGTPEGWHVLPPEHCALLVQIARAPCAAMNDRKMPMQRVSATRRVVRAIAFPPCCYPEKPSMGNGPLANDKQCPSACAQTIAHRHSRALYERRGSAAPPHICLAGVTSARAASGKCRIPDP
jgi:hypothetical protein